VLDLRFGGGRTFANGLSGCAADVLVGKVAR
jgi:hypothetical protein